MSKSGDTGAYAYKTGAYIFYNGNYYSSGVCDARFFRESGENWGAWHENGHVYDFHPIEEAELTNNLFPLMMQRRYNIRSRLEGDRRFVNVFNYLNYKKLFGDSNWYGLPILRQLEIYAGEDSYPKFCRYIRDNNYDGISKRERIVVGFSKIVGHDLSPHLDRTALYQCGSNCKNYIKDLPPCNVSIEYIVERHFYDRKEVPSTAVPKILAVYILDDGRLRFLVDFEGGGSWSNMGGVEIRDEDENFVCFLDSSDIIISADKWEPGKVFKFRGFGLDMKMRQPLVYKVPSKFHRSTFNFSVQLFQTSKIQRSLE